MSGKRIYLFSGDRRHRYVCDRRYFHLQGEKVCGYDRTPTELTEELIKGGHPGCFVDDVSSVPDNISRVIWTPAIPRTNHDFPGMLNSGVTMHKRSAVLDEILHNTPNIAITGTHGKTTTGTIVKCLWRTINFQWLLFSGACLSITGIILFIWATNGWLKKLMIWSVISSAESWYCRNNSCWTRITWTFMDPAKCWKAMPHSPARSRNGDYSCWGHISQNQTGTFWKKSVHHSVRIPDYGHGEGSVQCTIRTSEQWLDGFWLHR